MTNKFKVVNHDKNKNFKFGNITEFSECSHKHKVVNINKTN